MFTKEDFFTKLSNEDLVEILWELAFKENLSDDDSFILDIIWNEVCFRSELA